jgi:putative ABC transport system permease protein
MENLSRNLRIAVRSLARTPGFVLVAVLTLALGIGLSTTVFTVTDAMLFRRLPVLEQDRVVALWGETRDRSFSNVPLSLADARTFRRQTRTLSSVAFFTYEGSASVPVRSGDRVSEINQSLVSGNFFDVLGARPILGRSLRPDDDATGARPVVVLSHRGWQHRFGGDSSIVGREILLGVTGVAYTVVGVMPRGLDYPRGVDFWGAVVPFRTRPGEDTVFYADVDLVGRLRPGVAPENARDELTAYLQQTGASVWRRDAHALVHTLPRLVIGEVRSAVIVFAVAVALLLLITCVNVANLLLVRGLSRVREIAVRRALGAGRARIVSQLMTESALLAVAGGVAGVLLAIAAVQVFVTYAPSSLPRLDEIDVNGAALWGAIGITAAAVLLFGLAPAVMVSRVELEQVLRADLRQSASRVSRSTAEVLVGAQIAIAVMVLSAAGLVLRSFQKLERADLSFEPSHVLVASLASQYEKFDTKEKQLALVDRVMSAVKAVPGVVAASPVVAVPFSFTAWDGRPGIDGQTPAQAASNPMLNMEVVEPDYFAALGIPVIRGRAFTPSDREGAPRVAMLSESAARHYWPGADPIGKHVRMGGDLAERMTVVGIVPNTRYRDLRDARPSIYFPLRQSIFPFVPANLAIRVSGDPSEQIPSIRRVIEALDPGVAISDAAPLETFMQRPLAQPRLNALLLAVFAATAVLLAAVGLVGVMSTMVRQRTREIGIRMALGATAPELGRMVMRRGLIIGGGGVVVGLVAATIANHFLEALLYHVQPTDVATLAGVAVLLLVVAAVASAIPARSTTRVDPTIALRAEG